MLAVAESDVMVSEIKIRLCASVWVRFEHRQPQD